MQNIILLLSVYITMGKTFDEVEPIASLSLVIGEFVLLID
jgi:hypothetical protein